MRQRLYKIRWCSVGTSFTGLAPDKLTKEQAQSRCDQLNQIESKRVRVGSERHRIPMHYTIEATEGE